MKKHLSAFLAFWLITQPILLSSPWAALRIAQPECPVTGHATCSDGVDNDHDGTVDEAAPTAAFAASGANYRAKIEDCQKLTFANETDATFPTGNRVAKAPGTHYVTGEIACAFGTFTKGSYEVHWIGAIDSPFPHRAMWVKSGTSHGLVPDNVNDAVFISGTTVSWRQLFKTGSFLNFSLGANSSTALTVSLDGAGVIYLKSEASVKHGCIYLRLVGDTTEPSCPAETPGGSTPHYEIFKVSGTVPTSAATFPANSNLWNWIGAFNAVETTPTLNIVHKDNVFYFLFEATDGEIVAATSINDSSAIFSDDRLEITFRNSTATTTRDTNTYKAVINCRNPPAIYTAHYPSNVATVGGWNPSISATVDFPAGKCRIFAAIPSPFSLTDGLEIRGDFLHQDKDAATDLARIGCGSALSGFNSPSNWCVWKISATTVPGAADTTAPTVSSPAVPSGTIEKTTAIMTATTNEAGTCRVHYGTATGVYTNQSSGSQDNNLACSEAITGLTANTQYFVEMRVTDAAGNVGDSTEVSFTTDPDSPPATGCDRFAGPTTAGAADGTSQANRYLISSFYAQVSSSIRTLCLDDGTYTGASSMIVPTASLSGTSLSPLIIKAITPGNVLIDGQNARVPISLCNNNDWWIIEGVNARASSGHVLQTCSGSDNIVFRKVIGWDANINGNNTVAIIGGGVNNLIEDSAFFGRGRKTCTASQSGHSNSTWRRVFCAYGGTNITGGPDTAISPWYNSYGMTLENVIATSSEIGSSTDQMIGVIAADRIDSTTDRDVDVKILGTIVYGTNNQINVMGNGIFGAHVNQVEIKDTLVFLDTNFTTRKAVHLGDCKVSNSSSVADCSDPDLRITNTSLIGGGVASFIDTLWSQTNVKAASTYAGIYAGAETVWSNSGNDGATICKRYVNRVLTTTGIFTTDWQDFFVTRLNAAIVTAGRSVQTITGHSSGLMAMLEQKFGTIPAACK